MLTLEPSRLGTTIAPGPFTPRWFSDSMELAPHPAAVAVARLHVRRAVRSWQLEELADDAAQVVSELVCNGIEAHRREHLNAPVRLTLLAGLRTVLIVVRDASAGEPVPARPDTDAESGRGLLIVDALAAQWDIRRAPGGGKTVRALLRGKRPVHSGDAHPHGQGNPAAA